MSTLSNDFTPIYAGDLEPLVVQFVDGNLNPIPLTNLLGTAISMRIQHTKSGVIIACAGPWTISDATNAIAAYQWQPGETATPGFWNTQITVQYAAGPETFGPDMIPPLEIKAKF